MASDPLTTWQELVAGDDRKAVDGRALTWQLGPNSVWPNLASATLALVIGHSAFNLYGNLPVTWTATVPATPANPTTVSLDATTLQTGALAAGQYDYMLTATLLDGDKVTIAQGKLSVTAAPGMSPLYPPTM